jgi:Carboxypeptidase regulatory-like domain
VKMPRIGICLLISVMSIAAVAPALRAAPRVGGLDGASAAAMADDDVASVSGAVTNASGKAVAGATVSISTASGFKQSVITDKQGKYWSGGLAAGTYSISVTAKDFKGFQVADVALVVGDVVPLDVVLEAGKSTATLSASAAPATAPSPAAPAAATTPTAPPTPSTSSAAATKEAAPTPSTPIASTPAQGAPASATAAAQATAVTPPASTAPATSAVPTTTQGSLASTQTVPATSTVAPAETQATAATPAAKVTPTPTKSAKTTKTAKPASMNGMVTDMSGTAIPGASVSVASATGYHQTAVSDAKGNYTLKGLPPGSYDVSASAPGFKPFAAPGVSFGPGDSIPLDATLELEKTTSTAEAANASASEAATNATSGQTAATPQAGAAAESTQKEQAQNVPTTPEWLNVTPVIPPPPPGAKAPMGQNQPAVSAIVIHDAKSASISGSVTDQTGAVLAGATVTVSNASGFKQSVASNSTGAYAVNGVPPGTYDISVTAPAFKTFQAAGVTVVAGDSLPLDATLEPGGEKTEVNVQAGGAAQVETENAEVSGTITAKEVVNLGLNGRNFTQLIALTPGVSNQTGQDEAKVGVQGSVKYSVNGGRVEYNSFEVDGSDVLNAGLSGAESTLVVYPSLDAIQEIKVLTSNYGAQYGRTASGIVQVTTKSGGPQWHGSGYEFLRNEFFNARNYFDQTTKAPLYRRNDFGFNIGGPLTIPGHYNVNKDKTFIFFSEEVRIEKSPSELQPDFNRAVPTAAERQGNFSDVCPNPNDPADARTLLNPSAGQYLFPIASFPDCPRLPGAGIPGYGQLFSTLLPNNSYTYNSLANSPFRPGAGLDPNALAILNQNLIPLPNSYTGCNSSLVGQVDHTTGALIMPCYDAVISEPTHWREELARLDQRLSPRVGLTLRYIHDSWNTVTPIPNWGTVTNTLPTVQNKFVGPGIDMMVRLTETLSPTLLNETVFSFTNQHITLANQNGPGGANFTRPPGLGNPNEVGTCTTSGTDVAQCPMGYLFNNGFGDKAPGIVIGGNNQEYGGNGFTVDTSYMPWEHSNPTYNFRDDVTRVMGKHTFQAGVQYVFAQRNETNGALDAATGDVQGLLSFSNVNGGTLNTGNAFANFLYNAGQTNITGGGNAIHSYTQDSSQLRYHEHYQIAEPFLQDDWRVTPRLTLNLGVRISLFGPWQEKNLQAYNWDPSVFSQTLAAQVRVDPYTGQLIGVPGNRPIPFDLSNLDPRLINGLVQCGVHGVPAGCVNNHLFNPVPRVGFAWDPKGDGKTSVRAGYGMFFEHGTGDEANAGSLEGSAPNVLSVTQPFPAGYACIGNYGKDCNPNGISLPGAFPLNFTSIPTQTKYSYSQQWSLSVQRELPKDFLATFAYVGSKGTHLTVERQLNQLAPVDPQNNPYAINEPILPGNGGQGDCQNLSGNINRPVFQLQNGTVVSYQNPASINLQVACTGASSSPLAVPNTFRPYPGIGEIFSLQNVADSTYHAFQTTVRRTKGPLTAGVSYSFSHSIDDASDRTDPTFVNSLDLRSNKASSNFDQRHLLNISYVYTVPNLSKTIQDLTTIDPDTPPGTPSHFLRLLADGWQLSGITVFQSGTPFSVINNAGTAGIGELDNAGVANGVGAGSYPDVVKNPAPTPVAGNNASSFGPLLLNPNEFIAPRGLTFGDAGRNFLNNPSRLNFDASLIKHFQVTEGSILEFRVEAFNVFNHTQFRIYNPDLGNTGSNSISCYGGPNYSAGAYFPGQVDCLTGNSFLHPVDAHRARTLQLGAKYTF